VKSGAVKLGNPFFVGGPGIIDDSGSMTFTGNGILAKSNTLEVITKITNGVPSATTFSGIIEGLGSLNKDGPGTLVLAAANAYTGTTHVSVGTLRVGAANAIPSASAVTVASGATLDLNNFSNTIGSLGGEGTVTLGTGAITSGADNTSTTFGGFISGNGGRLIKTGTGTFAVSGANTYTGGTTLLSGTLLVGNNSALGLGTLTLQNGTLQASAAVNVANSFTVNGAAMVGGGNDLTFTGAGSLSNTLIVTNTARTTIASSLSGSGALEEAAGTGMLLLMAPNNYSGGTTLRSGVLILFTDSALGSGSVALNGGILQANRALTLANPFTSGGQASIGGSNNLTFSGAGTLLTASTLAVANTATTTFSASISGGGALAETAGTGSLVLATANFYGGGTALNSGTLVLANAGSLGPGVLALNGGNLLSTVTLSLLNAFTVTGNPEIRGSFTFAGSGTLNSGGTLVVNNAATTTFQGPLAGMGSLQMAGTGTLVLSAANSYSGATTVNAGTLLLGVDNGIPSTSAVTVAAGGASLKLSVFDDTIGSLSGAGIVNLGSGILKTGDSTSTVFSGTIQGMGGLEKLGSGAFTLTTGSPFFNGTSVLTNGILAIGDSAALGNGKLFLNGGTIQASVSAISLDNTFTVNGPATIGGSNSIAFTKSGTLANTLTTTNTATTTFAGPLGGLGSLTVSANSGIVMLSSANSFSGSTTINSGTLQQGVPGALSLSSAVMMNGGILNLNNIDATIPSLTGSGSVNLGTGKLTTGDNTSTFFSGKISGSGGVIKVGTGTFSLAGNNDYGGATNIRSGIVQVESVNGIPQRSAVNVDQIGKLIIKSVDLTIASLSGSGDLTLGSGTLTTGGDNTDTIYSGAIGGPGSLRKVGSGKLTLIKSSTYQGTTVVAQGTLQLAADHTLPDNSHITVVAGAALDISGQNDFMAGSSITGTGSVSFSDGTANISGMYDLTGSTTGTQVIGGTVNFLSPVISLGNALVINKGLANFSSGAPILIPMLTLSGDGVLSGSDAITVSSEMSWTAGTMNGLGSTNIDSGGGGEARLDISGDATKYLTGSRTLNNRPGGHIIWMGTGGIWMSPNTSTRNGGAFDSDDDHHFFFNGASGDPPQVINTGTFNSKGTITLDHGVTFTNSGTVRILTGALNLADDYTQDGGSTTTANGAILKAGGMVNIVGGSLAVFGVVNGNVMNAGLLSGSGTINGSVINAGQINPGEAGTTSILTINGDYTQLASGVLNIRVGGHDPGSGYDQLIITGTATLDGTLNVRLVNFTPQSGDVFQILTFNLLSGTFAIRNIDSAFMDPPLYNPMDVTLQAI
jgi:fibronectin-binding autotransporter adhesin